MGVGNFDAEFPSERRLVEVSADSVADAAARKDGAGASMVERFAMIQSSAALDAGNDGWTVFTPSADTRTVYVSSSAGSDNNDGLSPSTPVRTLAAGRALLRHGYPDWMLLQRGDVWQESLGHWTKAGRSLDEPMLVSTYGNDSERPLLQTGSQGGIVTSPGGGSPSSIDNLAIVGLHFVAHTYTGVGECTGARMLQPSSYFLIEDCMFEGYGTNIVFQAYSPSGNGRHHGFAVRRSTIVDAFTVHGSGPHPQGLYASGVDGLLVEECVFDHNGWSETVPNAGADIFSHNLYIDNDNSHVVVRRNVIANASSHGMQLRCGGVVRNNLFVRNSINLLVGGGNAPNPGGVTADVLANVIIDGKNIDSANPRGWGMCFANIASGRVSFNVIANNVDGTQPTLLGLAGDAAVDYSAGIGIHDLQIDSNVFHNWGGSLEVQGNNSQLTNIDLLRNDVQNLNTKDPLIAYYGGGNFESSEDNRFFSVLLPYASWTQFGSGPQTIDFWKAALGDTTSWVEHVAYAEPDRSVDSYHGAIGGQASLDAFLSEARQQSSTNWRTEYRAINVNRYLREGFKP